MAPTKLLLGGQQRPKDIGWVPPTVVLGLVPKPAGQAVPQGQAFVIPGHPRKEVSPEQKRSCGEAKKPPENLSGNLVVGMDNLVIGKQVGQGAYATVKVAFHRSLNREVALKIYDKARLLEPQRQKSVQREIKIMARVNNEFIAKLYEAFDTAKQVVLVMEYVRGSSLHGYLKSHPGRRLPEWEAKRLFKQVMTGIAYCHSRSIAHRDIKLENILLDEHNNIRIIDFGFSTCIPNAKKIKIFCGTPSYMAPEIVLRKEYAGPPADVWALGVLLYAMLCGTFPFKGSDDKELYRRIGRGYFEMPEHLSTFAKALLLRMLQVDPDRRPTADEILSDVWINANEPVIRPLSTRRSESHDERSFLHEQLQREAAEARERLLVPRSTKTSTSGATTVTNNINIVNNITHITYGRDPAEAFIFNGEPQKENDPSVDRDIVSSIVRLGYSNSEVAQQLQDTGSHIYVLYNKIREQRQRLNVGIAPQFVPSISSSGSRQNSARSRSRPAGLRDNDQRLCREAMFGGTSPFVLRRAAGDE